MIFQWLINDTFYQRFFIESTCFYVSKISGFSKLFWDFLYVLKSLLFFERFPAFYQIFRRSFVNLKILWKFWKSLSWFVSLKNFPRSLRFFRDFSKIFIKVFHTRFLKRFGLQAGLNVTVQTLQVSAQRSKVIADLYTTISKALCIIKD